MITFREKYQNNLILLKTFDFAKKVVQYTEKLEDQKRFVIANQLLKSGTSIERALFSFFEISLKFFQTFFDLINI